MVFIKVTLAALAISRPRLEVKSNREKYADLSSESQRRLEKLSGMRELMCKVEALAS